MAGALIVERDDDQYSLNSVDEIDDAAEEVMVLQQIPYMANIAGDFGGIGPISEKLIDEYFGPTRWSALGRYATVNGLLIPTIRIAPGEVRRLRLIASGQHELPENERELAKLAYLLGFSRPQALANEAEHTFSEYRARFSRIFDAAERA
jgi:hypothetical protein